jgi:hypothetical protein
MGDVDSFDDFAVAVYLRYLRGVEPVVVGQPHVSPRRDGSLLKFHWALSDQVRRFAEYVLSNRHEVQGLLAFQTRNEDAVARGRIDPRASAVRSLRTGSAAAMVVLAPTRTFESGPNQVLGWVTQHANLLLGRFLAWQQPESAYHRRGLTTFRLLDQARRLEPLRSASETIRLQRPVASAVLQAGRARQRIYKLAADAYSSLLRLEHGDAETVAEVLRSTLLGPLERWRRLELATALAIGEALSLATGEPLQLHLIGGKGTGGPIAQCGRFAIYWQTTTDLYTAPPLEPSEQKVQDILSSFNLALASDRPDLVVVDSQSQEPVAIIEVKLHAGDNPTAQFRDGIAQIVRYSRGYAPPQADLLERSMLVMNTDVPTRAAAAIGTPDAFSFAALTQPAFADWIRARWL